MADLETYARSGIAAINEKKYDEAVTAFKSALSLDPTRPDINNALGMAYVHRGDVGNAIPHLEEAVKLARAYTAEEHQEMRRHFHVGLATAYQLYEQLSDAEEVLRDIIKQWPNDAEAHLQLAQLLVGSCRVEEGLQAYNDAMPCLDNDGKHAVDALVGSTRLFLESEHEADIFLKAHRDEYVRYFDEVAGPRVEEGWMAEAARMGRGEDGEPVPIVAEGARPYALTRVDLVDPVKQEISGVYSEEAPMVVAVEGLDPLAQVPVLLPWSGWGFEVWVCSRCPWHWLSITIQVNEGASSEWQREIDELIGGWYLEGWNGSFGTQDAGRFHYIGDPEAVGEYALSYVVDLGRAEFDAIGDLLRKLTVASDRLSLRRVMFGRGRLPN